MYKYLEPLEDGLPVRNTGAWAAEKLDYIRRYIAVFISSMYRKRWRAINYIDLFAGPGKCQIRETGSVCLGSPLLALTAPYPFSQYYFNDLDPEIIAALRERCSSSPQRDCVRYYQEDANSVVYKVIEEIRATEKVYVKGKYSWTLNLAVLDPEGLDLHWETVEALGSLNRMDLIIHYPQMGIERNLRLADQPQDSEIDRFFGSRAWRNIYRETVRTGKKAYLHRYLMDHYKERLHNLGYLEAKRDDEVYDEPLMRNTEKNAPLYRLLFASKHELGKKFWHDVASRDVHGQRRLFEH